MSDVGLRLVGNRNMPYASENLASLENDSWQRPHQVAVNYFLTNNC
jgi:hypothetical protein